MAHSNLSDEPKITILRFQSIVHHEDVEKDSASAYWLCDVKFLSFKSLKLDRQFGKILIENFSAGEIKTGQYCIADKDWKGFPLFKQQA